MHIILRNNLVKIYFLIIFSVSILIYFFIVETISSLKNLNNALNDYYDYNEDNDVLKEKKIMMEAFIKEYFQMSQKDFNNYPDIVFSKKVHLSIENCIIKQFFTINIDIISSFKRSSRCFTAHI